MKKLLLAAVILFAVLPVSGQQLYDGVYTYTNSFTDNSSGVTVTASRRLAINANGDKAEVAYIITERESVRSESYSTTSGKFRMSLRKVAGKENVYEGYNGTTRLTITALDSEKVRVKIEGGTLDRVMHVATEIKGTMAVPTHYLTLNYSCALTPEDTQDLVASR